MFLMAQVELPQPAICLASLRGLALPRFYSRTPDIVLRYRLRQPHGDLSRTQTICLVCWFGRLVLGNVSHRKLLLALCIFRRHCTNFGSLQTVLYRLCLFSICLWYIQRRREREGGKRSNVGRKNRVEASGMPPMLAAPM